MMGSIQDYGAGSYLDPETDRILFEAFMADGNETHDTQEDDQVESYDLNEELEDASKWSTSDFYEEAEEKLQTLLSSGKTFSAYGSCRKEPFSFDIKRSDKGIHCTVFGSMDEDTDLIDNALWSVYGKQVDLSDEESCSLLDIMYEAGVLSEDQTTVFLPLSADMEDIKNALDDAEEQTERTLERSFQTLKFIVADFIETREKEEV